MSSLTENEIEENWSKFEGELEKLDASGLPSFLGLFGQRLAECPASAAADLHNSFVGGLLDHSLRVLRNARRVMKFSPQICSEVSASDITLAALLHDVGKVGSKTEEKFILNTDNYKLQRGWNYQYNPKCPQLPSGTASIALLMESGVTLPASVVEAILQLEPSGKTSDNYYKLSPLSFILQTAKITAILEEKASKDAP